jgi:hypothetical protein
MDAKPKAHKGEGTGAMSSDMTNTKVMLLTIMLDFLNLPLPRPDFGKSHRLEIFQVLPSFFFFFFGGTGV